MADPVWMSCTVSHAIFTYYFYPYGDYSIYLFSATWITMRQLCNYLTLWSTSEFDLDLITCVLKYYCCCLALSRMLLFLCAPNVAGLVAKSDHLVRTTLLQTDAMLIS